MRIPKRLSQCAVLLVLLLGACSRDEVMRRVAPAPVDSFVRAFLDTLRTGSDSAVLARVTPRIQHIVGIRDSIVAARAEFPPGIPEQIEMVAGQAFVPHADGATRRSLVYEVRTDSQWTIVDVMLLEEFGIYLVDGVRVTRSAASVRETHRFTLEGKSARHLFILLVAIAIPIFCLGVGIVVIRTPMRRRWLWALVALLGAGKFGFNWNTGETFAYLWSVQLFGVGLYRLAIAGPLYLVLSVPAGALVALERRRRALTASARAPSDGAVAPAAELALAPDERDVQGSHRNSSP